MASESVVKGNVEEKRSEEVTAEKGPCNHTKEQHEACVRKKNILTVEKNRTSCNHSDGNHDEFQKKG